MASERSPIAVEKNVENSMGKFRKAFLLTRQYFEHVYKQR